MIRKEMLDKAKDRFNSKVNSIEFEQPNLEIHIEEESSQEPLLQQITENSKETSKNYP